jgi:hypothetical protein
VGRRWRKEGDVTVADSKQIMGDRSSLSQPEMALVECYEKLAAVLRDHRDELTPFEERNSIRALAALWQVMNGLDLDPGQVYHLGA